MNVRCDVVYIAGPVSFYFVNYCGFAQFIYNMVYRIFGSNARTIEFENIGLFSNFNSPLPPLPPECSVGWPYITSSRTAYRVCTGSFLNRWNSLESAGDGGFMVIGLSGSLGDGDGSRLACSMTPTPFVCKCCIGCMVVGGGGGERRPLTADINGWPAATTVPAAAVPVPFWCSPSTGNPFSDRNSSRSQYWKQNAKRLKLNGDTCDITL